MKPAFLIAAAIVAVLGVAAIAFAATGGGDDNAQVPTATATPGNETRIPVEPDGGIGSSETPIPVEPDGGIGDTPVTSEPEPTAGPDTPIPSEPIHTVTPAPTQPSLPAGRHAEQAPIDQVDVTVAESFPPQYFVHIVAGLPSGCAEQYTHSVTRDGNMINIEVLNSYPDGNPICTAIYGQYEINVGLGMDFIPGQTYQVIVNDGEATKEFTAQ